MSECIVKNCSNHSNNGRGKFIQYPGDYHVHFVCEPCWEFILTAKPEYNVSTIYQNAKHIDENKIKVKLGIKKIPNRIPYRARKQL